MTKSYHDHRSASAFADELRELAKLVDEFAASLKKSGVKGIEINHEQARVAAANGVADWLADGEKKLRAAILANKRASG